MALEDNNKPFCAQNYQIPCSKTDPATPASCSIVHLSEHVMQAAEELGAIVEVTASASDTIISCAEAILEAETDSHDNFAALVTDQVTQILEACAFQDITGQRATRLTEKLQQMEARLARMAGRTGAAGMPDDMPEPSAEEAERDARRERLILHGPQSADDAISQDTVDAMFSTEGPGQAGRRTRGSR